MNKILTIAALALVLSACSNEDNDIQTPVEQPAKSEGIPFTATISIGESAMTRALTEDATNNQIVPTWVAGEKVALIHNGVNDEMSVASVSGGVATITGTITGTPTTGDAVTIIYPSTAADGTTGNVKANLLAAQDGTLATIAANYDVRKGTGTLKVSGTASLNGNVSLTNQNAIFKFTLSGPTIDASHPLVIKKGENDVVTTVTPASSTTSVYVAMPSAASSTYRFIVTTDNNKYIKSGTAAITAGKYYQTTLDLSTARYPLALSSATVDDLGSVIGADGKIYLNMTAATGASPATTAVAMIAYKSETAGKSLAIQLNASPEYMYWSAACSYSSYPSITGNPGTWRLPSKDDWQNMFVGCAKDGDDSDASDNILDPIAGFKEKIGATGITWLSDCYWSSTGTGASAWDVGVALGSSLGHAHFYEESLSVVSFYVLGCLAF
jgi:hypothetical protein